MANQGSESVSGTSARQPAFDADAVCVKCATVNPEGTLLCKTCGNNLREQRETRLAAAQLAGTSTIGGERSGWLSKALALLGILIVVWVATNISKVEDFLISIQMPSGSNAHMFWTGPSSKMYDELLGKLEANPITEKEVERAVTEPHMGDMYDGRYVLMQDHPVLGRREVGQVLVRQQGEKLSFVAKLQHNVEIRGDAWLEAADQPVARDSAAVRIDKEYYVAYGLALRRDNNGLECFGGSDYSDSTYKAMAYRVPFVE